MVRSSCVFIFVFSIIVTLKILSPYGAVNSADKDETVNIMLIVVDRENPCDHFLVGITNEIDTYIFLR